MSGSVAILEQKINLLTAENQQLKIEKEIQTKENKSLQSDISEAHQKYEDLIQKFKMAQRNRFGATSERFIDLSDQLPLFDAPQKEVPDEPTEYEDIAYTRKKKKTAQKTDHLPQREVIIPVEDKTCDCGHERVVIDYESKHLLHFIPAQVEVLIQKREVVACNRCDKGIETAPLPKHILPKCKATESLLSHIAVTKILDRNPLYHIEKSLEREFGWHIKRATMARWMIQLGIELQPLVNLLKDQIYDYDIASADATSLQVLKTPDKRPQTKSTAYCIRGGPPGKEVILFDYMDIGQELFLADIFSPFSGTLMVDGAPCFEKLAKKYPIALSHCHAHARRKFEQVYKASKKKGKLAKFAMQFYTELYRIERYAKDNNFDHDQLLNLRQDKSAPLMAQFKDWLDIHKDKTLPTSSIGKAINYALKYWPGLQLFLSDPRLDPDNNATERQIKYFVMARKNFIFCDTQPGADALGALFTVILSAKAHGLNPRTYLESVFKRLPLCGTHSQLDQLLPWNLSAELS